MLRKAIASDFWTAVPGGCPGVGANGLVPPHEDSKQVFQGRDEPGSVGAESAVVQCFKNTA